MRIFALKEIDVERTLTHAKKDTNAPELAHPYKLVERNLRGDCRGDDLEKKLLTLHDLRYV